MRIEKVDVKVVIHNLPEQIGAGWLVVRDTRDALWYYGTYEDEQRALEVAEDIGNGIVLEYWG